MKFKIATMLAALLLTVSAHAEEAAAKKAVQPPAPPKQAGRPALKARPVGDKAIIRTVADAMGFVRGMGAGETTKTINRVQWSGTGQLTEGTAVYPITQYTYTISLHLKAAREDMTRTVRGKPERLVRVLLDQEAWDEREPGLDGKAASDTPLNRRLQLARTPFGFTRAMLDADPAIVKVVDPGPAGKVTIAFSIEGTPVTTLLNSDYRPDTITMKVDGKEIVERYTNYKDLSEYGLMFATRWSETIDGHPHLSLSITEGRVASYAVFPKPIASAAQAAN
jgi:hypothetical protein